MSGAAPDRDPLVRAALAVVDRDGLEGLTHTRIAVEADVAPAAVSARAATAGDLEDLVVEAVITGHDPLDAAAPGDWPGLLRGIGLVHRLALLRSPNALAVLVSRPVRTDAALDVVEGYLAALVRAGLDAPHALAAFNAVVVWTHGYVMSEVAAQSAPEDVSAGDGGHPHLASALTATTWGLPDGEFTFGLDALVDGLRAELTV